MKRVATRHVLVIKTSSLGDVVHTLIALTDATREMPGIRFDWLVEESLAALPALHRGVDRVIPVAFRRWRRQPVKFFTSGEYGTLKATLARLRYDAVIDAQGLLKSALLSRFAKGPRYGLDWSSVREPLASLAYEHRIRISKDTHAVVALRRLFGSALSYPVPDSPPALDIDRSRLPISPTPHPYVVFLHGTQWESKEWPESYWIEMARLVAAAGFDPWLPAKGAAEAHRAALIARHCANAKILAPMAFPELVAVLANAKGVVGVDTGLAHLSAALGIPTVVLFGPTSPGRTGAVGQYHRNLSATFPCAPCLRRHCHYNGSSKVKPACFSSLSPGHVLNKLTSTMAERPDD